MTQLFYISEDNLRGNAEILKITMLGSLSMSFVSKKKKSEMATSMYNLGNNKIAAYRMKAVCKNIFFKKDFLKKYFL